jgi:LacI family transcriptional regulator
MHLYIKNTDPLRLDHGNDPAQLIISSKSLAPDYDGMMDAIEDARQQLNRERGFRQYLADNCPKCEIVDVNLYAYDKQGMREIMREAFAENPDVRLGVSFNSSIHLIGDFLRTEMPEHPHVTLLGYDMLEANVRCVKQGFVDFLIAQHPHKQGLNCFRSMFNTCVLHSKPTRDHYVSIELLTKENIDYYED